MNSLTLPTLFCPFPSAVNRHADAVHQDTLAWAKHFNLITTTAAYQRFSAAQFGWLAARAYPDALREELQIVSDWNTWLFMLDDQCDEGGIGKQPDQLAQLFASFVVLLQGGDDSVSKIPLAQALVNLRQRLSQKATAAWMLRFIASTQDYFAACHWEATNRAHRIVPDVASYIAMRPLSGGLNTDVDLIDITERINLPPEVRTHPTIQALTLMANNVVCWSNDIFSLEKEMQRGDVHNLVLVLRHADHLTLQEAIDRAAAMHDAEVRAFIELAAMLPSFDPAINADLSRYVSILRSWMRGNLDWSHATGRYRPT